MHLRHGEGDYTHFFGIGKGGYARHCSQCWFVHPEHQPIEWWEYLWRRHVPNSWRGVFRVVGGLGQEKVYPLLRRSKLYVYHRAMRLMEELLLWHVTSSYEDSLLHPITHRIVYTTERRLLRFVKIGPRPTERNLKYSQEPGARSPRNVF